MILIASGANLPSRFGSARETLAHARTFLNEQDILVIKTSRTWLTAPVPFDPNQPWYHNEVMRVETDLNPKDLMERLLEIERDFGRVRSTPNAPRILDLDLLTYGDRMIDTPELTVPHPRMAERAFVLMPLRDVAPEWAHPVTGLSLEAMIAALPPGQKGRPLRF